MGAIAFHGKAAHAVALMALAALSGCASAPEPAVEARRDVGVSSELAFHLFGVTGQGYALDDVALAREVATEADAERVDTQKECADKASLDAEERLRLKFRCMMKVALGHHKAWRRSGDGKRLEFVLFFNGGLSKPSNSTDVARQRYADILKSRRYPVFMIWPTGFRQSYGNALFETRDADYVDPRSPANLFTGATQAASDALIGVGRLPKSFESDTRFLLNDYGRTPVARSAGPWRAGSGRVQGVGEAARNVYFSDRVDDPSSLTGKDAVSVALAPVRPASLTLAGVGASAWDNMVRRTRTSIHNIDEFRAPDGADAAGASCARGLQRNGAKLRRCFPRGAGAFSRFFHWYSACAKPDSVPAGSDDCPLEAVDARDRQILRDARLTLIGHSMGSIVINEIVTAYPELPYENIVFMAGADSVRSTYRTVVPLVERNKGCTKFFNLMLHPYNDANEVTAFGAAPRGSLLEYIDHYLASPRSIDDRTVGKWANVAATKHLFGAEAQKWMLFNVLDRSKAGKFAPLNHGGFNDGDFARPSFWNPSGAAFDQPSATACDGRFFSKPA